MFGRRYDITATLDLLSPMHVGTGEFRAMRRPGSNDTSNVDLIARDYKDLPYIPPTTVKGLLRRLGEAVLTKPGEVADLFGDIKVSKTGQMGMLLARGAALAGNAPVTKDYPYASAEFVDWPEPGQSAPLSPGSFIAAHASINPQSGTAADHKLFFQEMCAPGAAFELRLVLIGEDGGGQARLECLRMVLAALGREQGVPCGGGKGDGAGALKLRAGSLKIVERTIGADGSLKDKTNTAAPPEIADKTLRWRGAFVCDGPFISVDSSHVPKNDAKKDGEARDPSLRFQKGQHGTPLALGSQVMGVLRARARWLEGLRLLEKNRSLPPDEIANLVDSAARRDGQIKIVKFASDLKPGKNGEPAKIQLTPVERLFGVTGFAGLLALETMQFSGGEELPIASVKLDHFSGAPIDNALFTTLAVIGVRLQIGLALRGRAKAGALTQDDEKLFRDLVEDMGGKRDQGAAAKADATGLTLGHAWGKGFGWFNLEKGGWE